MLTQSQIDAIAEAVLQSMKPAPAPKETRMPKDRPVEASEVLPMDASFMTEKALVSPEKSSLTNGEGLVDITSPEVKAIPLLDHAQDREGLERMMARTPARIGVGNCGPRLKTRTMLTLRADHAAARDAVFMDVSPELLDGLNLFLSLIHI